MIAMGNESPVTEDSIVASIIEKAEYNYGDSAAVIPEVHYNYYGDRGVVDAVMEVVHHPSKDEVDELVEANTVPRDWAERALTSKHLTVHEVKSEMALDGVTGANEVVRQFNRHREYFFKGSGYTPSNYQSVSWQLVFAPSEAVYQHISDHVQIYQNLDEYDNVSLMWMTPNGGQMSVFKEESMRTLDYLKSTDFIDGNGQGELSTYSSESSTQ